MNRKIKNLGLALIAVLALSGVAAVDAQAETAIESELKDPAVTTLDATNASNKHGELVRLTFGNGARFVECTNIDINGSIIGSATTIVGNPEFTNCFVNNVSTSPATWTDGKCAFNLTALKASTGNLTIGCPGGIAQIEIHVYENASAHIENKPLCTYDIKGGQTLTGATISTGGAAGKTHDLNFNLTSLTKFKVFNTGPGGLAVCGLASGKEGEAAFSGNLTISGTNSIKQQVGITLI